MQSFIGSPSWGPSTLLLEGTAGIGKSTLWRAGISEGNPFFAPEIARALTGQRVRPTPGEPLPVPEDL
ncbi:MAG TPA: hypothetical protein VFW32_10680, partial [Actinomycetes bacterium]|nr:hypothetical protein [Actinomycetes bacterium]